MFHAIGTVFNTFWPRLATVFLDLMHVAHKHALGPDPRLCSGFAVTTCKKTTT
ncbi:hypothetical protein [Mesorhizobium sp.]|uniref:hypothetical protein n=1 Tax=Mesorhizobium sp. TaxID=1871066 RepID=UPI002579E6CB|nr:hypothetical protein [Mesorhizobium sp.]